MLWPGSHLTCAIPGCGGLVNVVDDGGVVASNEQVPIGMKSVSSALGEEYVGEDVDGSRQSVSGFGHSAHLLLHVVTL